MNELLQPVSIARLLSALFLGVLFLQSGLDKVFDWKGNLSWLKEHFAQSPLRNMVPMLLGIITLTELAAGLMSAVGAGLFLVTGGLWLSASGAALSGLALLMLFTGQRLAKDYAGAATLVSYFILSLVTLLLHSSWMG
ncbi:MAG: DoxX family protein [Bacteroidetes bacterium]|nr:MAG: DoxX family protein [Bacteroidota bacterium]